MSLADEIRALRDRTVADLNASYDYHANTRFAWKVVRKAIVAGRKFNLRNKATGSTTSHLELLDKSREYTTRHLTEATFQQFIAIFEAFFFDLLRLWLTAYPQNLFAKKVDFRTIFEAADKDAVTQLVVNKELNELLYERPAEWFKYLDDRVTLGCPQANDIERFAEAKATRDVLVHNRGVVGKVYVGKAGKLARFQAGERIDLTEQYHREVWELLRRISLEVSDAALAKSV